MGEKGQGIKVYKLPVINSDSAVKYGTGNIFSNIVRTMYDVRLVLDFSE